MDLTYMPGELDYKKKGNDMKREHDSVDDFEHLDPELSPVDSHSKDISSGKERDGKSDSLSEQISFKDHKLIDPLIEGLPSEKLGSVSTPLGHVESELSNSNNKEFSIDSSVNNFGLGHVEKSSLLDFGATDVYSPLDEAKFEVDPLNTSFISEEIASNIKQTDKDNELLSLDDKVNDHNIQDLPADRHDKPVEKESNVKELDYDNSKSMKEADALSQYEIKYDRKELPKKDDTVGSESKKDDEHLIEDVELESDDTGFQKSGPEPIKSQPEINAPEPKPEISIPKSQPEPPAPKLATKEPEPEPFQSVSSGESIPETFKDLPEKDSPVKETTPILPKKPLPTITGAATKTSVSDLDDIIGPEDVFKRIGLVEALVYWRDPKKSGIVFGSVMAILISICYMSLISVIAYSFLLVLLGTISFRIYKNILQAVQKTSEGHPFKEFLELELALPQDKVREMVDTAVVHINAAIVELRRLFLVEDLIDSIKFGVCLWCLTYVGAIFNGMTLVMLGFVALFTVPKIYENNKANIDTYLEMGRSKVAEITSKVKAAVPIGKKETEKDKEQ